jgi:hypothetical protein
MLFTRISLLRTRAERGVTDEGMVLARHDGDFRIAAEELLSLNELLELLNDAAQGAQAREDAIACYLSGADGWREAMKLLGGTFAEGATKLSRRKDD